MFARTMTQTPDAILNELAVWLKATIVAEVYARVTHIPMLAHYTNLDAFKSILRSRELWFSLIRDSTDTSEATEGSKIVAAALAEHGPEIFTNYATFDVPRQFEARRHMLETETHVFSLCEHGSDQRTDRLVMWQEYGRRGNGLCLILRKQTMLGQTAKGLFPVHWCPIEYEDAATLGARVRHRLQQVQDAIDATPMAETLPGHALGMMVAGCVVQLILGHKNVAYEHEKEVRFVRSGLLQELVPPEGAGYRTVTVDGQERSKFILPLRKYPEFSIDASLPALLDHIIIGPSVEQEQMFQEVRAILDANDLTQVGVHRSEIPYRAVR